MASGDLLVLILAPAGRDADVAGTILAEVGLRCRIAGDLGDLVSGLPRADCAVVTEEALLSADRRALANWVAEQPPWSDFPFVLLTSRGGPPDVRLPETLGNVTVLERPFHPAVLVNAVRSAIRARARQREVEAHQERQVLLIAELNHRVKNTLATVQSLAYQTFRQDASLQTARDRFEARLLSLSRTHNLLNESSWTGARLTQVLALELEPYVSDRPERLQMGGPEVNLRAETAVPVGMIVHELATNAAKYGALSKASGRIEIEWCIGRLEPSHLWLRWMERGGPTVTQPSRRGFGSRLIQHTARQQLDGHARVTFDPEGLVCEVNVRLGSDRDGARSAAE